VIPNSLAIKTTNDVKKQIDDAKKQTNEENSEVYSLTVEHGQTDSVVFKFSTLEEGEDMPKHGYTVIKDRSISNPAATNAVETDEACSVPQAGPSTQPDKIVSPKKSNKLTVSNKEIEESIGSLYILLVPLTGNTGRRNQAVSRRRNNRRPINRVGVTGRNRGRRGLSRRPRRRRIIRTIDTSADTDSDGVSSYDVEEVQYEEINDENVPRLSDSDWRVFPCYQLTSSEALQQEAELYQSFMKDKRNEGVEPVEGSETPCCVCYENKATRVVIPCGHLCLCYNCALNVVMSRAIYYGSRVPKFCPICQAAVALLPKVCK